MRWKMMAIGFLAAVSTTLGGQPIRPMFCGHPKPPKCDPHPDHPKPDCRHPKPECHEHQRDCDRRDRRYWGGWDWGWGCGLYADRPADVRVVQLPVPKPVDDGEYYVTVKKIVKWNTTTSHGYFIDQKQRTWEFCHGDVYPPAVDLTIRVNITKTSSGLALEYRGSLFRWTKPL